MKMLKTIILGIWQAPQNLVGLLFLGILKLRKEIRYSYAYKDCIVFYFDASFLSGGSLGNFIFMGGARTQYKETFEIPHEYGHYKQSLLFGPLYLIIIGIPSILNNLLARKLLKGKSFKEQIKWYYSRYPERWADILGDVPSRW